MPDARLETPGERAPLRVAYMAPQIGVLSATFVYRDVEGLRARGAEVSLFSLRRPRQAVTSAEADGFIRETCYLYDLGAGAVLRAAARRLLRCPRRFLRGAGLAVRDALLARTAALSDRPKLLWHFLAGCLLAELVERAGARHIHCNFAHAPAAVTMYAALLADVPYSFLCHAHDIFVHGVALREKTARAAFGMCSSNYNVRFLVEEMGCDPAKLDVMRTGVDLEAFPLRAEKPFSAPFQVLSVGRLVDKKGFDLLIAAAAELVRGGRDLRVTIVGGGPAEAALRALADDPALGGRVTLTGPLPQEEVRRQFAAADAFALPCRQAKDRDMDGTPIVLIEAMALGVPVVSTAVSGNPELIEDGVSGMLTAPEDAAAVAEALRRIMDDPDAARRMALRARETIERAFDLAGNIARLMDRMDAARK